jgi:hypothetical protein
MVLCQGTTSVVPLKTARSAFLAAAGPPAEALHAGAGKPHALN